MSLMRYDIGLKCEGYELFLYNNLFIKGILEHKEYNILAAVKKPGSHSKFIPFAFDLQDTIAQKSSHMPIILKYAKMLS